MNDKEVIRKVLAHAYNAIDDKFGKDIVMLDISNVSVMADYFIIATANNQTQLKAIADELEAKLYEQGVKLRHSEGYQSSKWILLDFGCIIAHIFTSSERDFYNLERIWGDAQVVLHETL